MKSSADDIVKEIRKKSRIQGSVTPCYGGLSLVNLSSSILDHFGAKHPFPALNENVLPFQMLKGAKNIVLLMVDGLGYYQLKNTITKRDLKIKSLMKNCSPITTVYPSTTAAALTSVNTALSPAQHGMIGYNLFLKEFGAISNMLRFKANAGKEDYVSLGVEPRKFFPYPTIYQRLHKKNVQCITLMPSCIADSGLSLMTHHGSKTIPYDSTAEMIVQIKKQLQTKKKTFVYAYHPIIDTIAHKHGKEEEHDAELANLDFSLFNDLISSKSAKDTLLLITADHGHMTTNKKRVISLLHHLRITHNLVMMPTGESRCAYLHVKNGKLEMVKSYCEEHFGKIMHIFTAEEFLQKGLLGPSPILRDTFDRIGDLVLIPKEDYMISWKQEPSQLIGRHGGLSEEEMLVPLIAKRL